MSSVLTMAFRKSGIYLLEKLLDRSSDPCEQSVASSSLANNATHNAPSATDHAFEVLDAALSTPTRSKYRQGVEENYDLEGSRTFVAWKKLHSLVDKPDKVVQTCSTPKKVSERINETPTSSSGLNSSSVSSTTILKEILTYPTLETNVKTKKNVKRALPNFVSGPESMQHLLDEKLKKVRQMAEKQQQLRKKKTDDGKPKKRKHKSHQDEKEKG